jgi:succinoglycan biosynthesis transport protein ExoP
MAEEHEAPQPSLDVVGILRRRGALLLAVAAVVVLVGVAIAYRSTPLYTSRGGVLLAELPGIAESAVRSTVPNYPEARVRIITQRVLTNDNLDEIIAKNGLYPELAGMPAEARSRLRDPNRLQLSAEDPQILESLLGTTRPEGAFAFSVKFVDPSPRVARDVASDVIALYLKENRDIRREQAADTIEFLTQQARRLETEIAAREKRIAEFKGENSGALPELAESNREALDRAGRDLDAVEQEIRSLRANVAIYTSELSVLSPTSTVLNDQGAPIQSSYDRLKALQREYLSKSSIYDRDHPDMQRLRRELQTLGESTGVPAFDRATLESELQARQDQLTAARERYAGDHPELVRLEKAVEAARKELSIVPRATRRMPTTPDNPIYIQRESQLQSLNVDLQAALKRRDDLRARHTELEKRLQVAPEVERDYNTLSRGYEQLLEQYNDTQLKIGEAQMALNLEEDPNSERFTVLEQPSMASSPSSPNRFAVLVLSLAIGVALGAAVVAIAERSDQAVRNAQDVVAYLEMPPLVAIPYVENRADIKRHSRRRLVAATVVSLWLGTVFLLVVTPL